MTNWKIQIVLAATAIALVAGLALAQSPEMIEERRAVGFVRAVGAGDVDALLAYMDENWTPAEEGDGRAARWAQLARDLTDRHTGIEVTGVLVERQHEIIVLAEGDGGPPLQFIFDCETEPPYRIAGLGIEAGEHRSGPELPELQIAADAGVDDIAAVLGKWFQRLADDDAFSGSALIAWKGQTIFEGAWGLASKRWDVPNSLATRFDLGSINKSFTQIAVAQLAEQGKLSFDDLIVEHLPEYPNADVAGKVTIRQLLNHSSGLGDIFTDEFFRSSKALYRSPRDFFPLFADQPLQFEPGSDRSYSNAGYMVLGAIIEAVSGQPYDEYVVDSIFFPAGMTNSGFFANDEPVPNVAVGYTRMTPQGKSDTWRNNLFQLPIKGNSAGSAQATAGDLLRFDEALREHRLLSPGYTLWYFGGEEPGKDTPAARDERVMAGTGIAGGAPGVSADLEGDGELTVIVLSNYDPPIAEAVAQQLFKQLGRALGE
jgi:CubicO group peptidase (beta-lactamase class C family)